MSKNWTFKKVIGLGLNITYEFKLWCIVLHLKDVYFLVKIYIIFTDVIHIIFMMITTIDNSILVFITITMTVLHIFVLSSTADMAITVKRLIWAKCINSGQTCIAPDYILCSQQVKCSLQWVRCSVVCTPQILDLPSRSCLLLPSWVASVYLRRDSSSPRGLGRAGNPAPAPTARPFLFFLNKKKQPKIL